MSPYITMTMCSMVSGCLLHFYLTNLFQFLCKMLTLAICSSFLTFDDSIDKEIRTKGGLGARG